MSHWCSLQSVREGLPEEGAEILMIRKELGRQRGRAFQVEKAVSVSGGREDNLGPG